MHMTTDWQRSLVTLAATVVTATVVTVLYWARSVFIPIALAIFLAFVLTPVVERLQRRGLGRVPSVLLTVGLIIALTGGVGVIVTHQITRLANTLPDQKEAIKAKIASAKQWLGADGESRLGQLFNDVADTIAPKAGGEPPVRVEPVSPSLAAQFDTYASPAIEFLGQAAFAFVLTVFMLLKKEDLRNRMIRLLGDGKVTTTTRAVDDASTRISRYLLMQAMVNTGFGLVITTGLTLLGVDYGLLWGLIAAVLRYVPYIGTPLGLLPAVLFSFATAPPWGGGWGQPLAALALFLVAEAICNNVLEPWLYGKTMGLSEVAQLVAAAGWAFLWGPIGLILSGPMTVCLLVLGRHVRRFSFLEVLLGDQPALTPRVAFYQRLAARDQDEAAGIALTVAGQDGLDAALENVVVPGLCIARRDLDDGDLDPADFRSAVHSAREIVEELGALRPETDHGRDDENRVRVLVVPARDEAEHVAAESLGLLLNPARWEVRVAGDEMLASELVAAVEEFRPGVVVLVALPPGGLSHCRYLVNRLRAKCLGLRIVVGRWTCEEPEVGSGDGIKGADGVDALPSKTLKRLTDLLPVLAAREEKLGAGGAPVPVGTGGA
jgi:predicted PurR-regulated permease PerM